MTIKQKKELPKMIKNAEGKEHEEAIDVYCVYIEYDF